MTKLYIEPKVCILENLSADEILSSSQTSGTGAGSLEGSGSDDTLIYW